MNDVITVFSQEEFHIMMELSGGGEYSLYDLGTFPDDASLIRAMVKLCKRNLIRREGAELRPTGEGALFARLRAAPVAVVMEAYRLQNAVVCYVTGDDALWMCELIRSPRSSYYRVWRDDRNGVRNWIFDAGILTRPVARDKDVMTPLHSEGREPSPEEPDTVLLDVKKYRNGGDFLFGFRVALGERGQEIRCRENGRETALAYTREALTDVLNRCFGKDLV